jgi:hypothetical protein
MAPNPAPLSGGDRKALKKELSKSPAMTCIFAERSAEKRREGEALIREADNLACQSWNEKMWSDGRPIDPSPTVDQAINGGYPWLEIKCSGCQTPRDIEACFPGPVTGPGDRFARGFFHAAAILVLLAFDAFALSLAPLKRRRETSGKPLRNPGHAWGGRKSMLRRTMPGGLPSNSRSRNFRAARSSIRSRKRRNCSSRWSGAVLVEPSMRSMASVLTAHGTSTLSFIIVNSTTMRLKS